MCSKDPESKTLTTNLETDQLSIDQSETDIRHQSGRNAWRQLLSLKNLTWRRMVCLLAIIAFGVFMIIMIYDLQMLNNRVNDLRKDNTDLQRVNKKNLLQYKDQESTIQDLKLALNKSALENQKKDLKIRDLQDEKLELLKQIASLNDSLTKLESDKQKVLKLNNKLKLDLENMRIQIQNLELALNQSLEHHEVKGDYITKLEDENTKLNNTVEGLTKELSNEKQRSSQFQISNNEMFEQLGEMKAEIERLQNRNAELKEELDANEDKMVLHQKKTNGVTMSILQSPVIILCMAVSIIGFR